MNIQHGKSIITTSYYDGTPTSTREEFEVSLISSRENILRDVIDAMIVINKGESHKLTIEIEVNSKGRYRLIKKWGINT